ncbi:MAG: YfhO family protein, partial [Clostridia bacterium]|nr:YfhO family protein [Clostridia bacterium]
MTKQNKMQWLAKMIAVLIFFGVVFYAVFTLAAKASNITTDAQKIVFPIGIAALLSGLSVLWIVKQIRLFGDDEEYSKWYFPIFSALLAFVCMALAYAYVGMWPIGTKSAMIVDMHHQYAPLLAQLRNTLLNGDSFLYSFDLGLGANYIPLFGYYLASPLNIILIFFPFRLLDTALLVITLLKNMLSAFFFAWMVQYVYGK